MQLHFTEGAMNIHPFYYRIADVQAFICWLQTDGRRARKRRLLSCMGSMNVATVYGSRKATLTLEVVWMNGLIDKPCHSFPTIGLSWHFSPALNDVQL